MGSWAGRCRCWGKGGSRNWNTRYEGKMDTWRDGPRKEGQGTNSSERMTSLPRSLDSQGQSPELRHLVPHPPKSAGGRRESRGSWVGTYQAKSRGQEEPGDLYQGPWPVANHVLDVVIETVCPCQAEWGKNENRRMEKSSWVFGKDSLGFVHFPPPCEGHWISACE